MRRTKYLVIWGTKAKGQNAFEILKEYEEIQIVAFGDNDPEQWGKTCCGKNIINVEQLEKLQDVDGVVIAASPEYIEEIYKGLENAVKVPIYRNVHDLADMRASIDISGWCNAQCRWCATGIKNRNGVRTEHTYMSVERFREVYEHLLEANILNRFNEVLLYSWGEPFLNPDYLKILEYLSLNDQVYSMSTNASAVKLSQTPGIYKNCRTFIFSMPGFSQKSYDKIHKFNFEKIKANIKEGIENIRRCGFEGDAILSYHVYQFNKDEIPMARSFAESLGIKFVPIYAYFAGFGLALQYLSDEMTQDVRKAAEQELILDHVSQLMTDRPADFECMIQRMISINAKGQIELCCCADHEVKDYEWGSVFNLKSYPEWEKLRKKMLHSETCKICRESGLCYWIFHNPPLEEKTILDK